MRILVVDDEPSILEVLKAFLEADGAHRVVTAISAAEALKAIEKADCDFDCLLLDIQMPGMNGIALCEKVRAMPDYAHAPIIMLTAMSQKPYIDSAFAVGATDYVTKPFEFLELRGRLRAAARIVEESNRAIDSSDQARRKVQAEGTEPKLSVDEPFSIEGIDRVVGYTALENYLFALSRTKLLFASTFAVVIKDFKALHQAATAKELRNILKNVARLIANGIPNSDNLVSYRGSGIFLCVNQKKSQVTPRQRMFQINTALAANGPVTEENIAIGVTVGQEISLMSFSRAGALVALRRAIDTVDREPISNVELIAMSNRALRGSDLTPEQSSLERRAYEIVLEEIMKEENRKAV